MTQVAKTHATVYPIPFERVSVRQLFRWLSGDGVDRSSSRDGPKVTSSPRNIRLHTDGDLYPSRPGSFEPVAPIPQVPR